MSTEKKAIILSINKDNFEKLIVLDSVKKIVDTSSFSNVLQKQNEIIEEIKSGFSSHELIQKYLEEILKEEIVSSSWVAEILARLDSHEELKHKTISLSHLNIKDAIGLLENISDDSTVLNSIKDLEVKIKEQKFVLGVTGVMNSGKSTMLNALLSKDVLGTSMIPETANLSVLKYSKKEFAKVCFWNEEEWKTIENHAKNDEVIQEFVNETKNNLPNFRTLLGTSVEAGIENLGKYTSAEEPTKLCNLVKSVDIFTDLEFLKNGVQIVDTPGLDDVVTKREEITKSFLSSCDVLLHLMNIKQSCTAKDIEFIVDTLLYENVSSLAIVLTKADTVSKSELEEVVAYTKKSIFSALKKNSSDKLDFILENIEFFCISGHSAMLHNTGKSEEAKVSLSESGFLELQTYLENMLYGENSAKKKIAKNAIYNEMNKIATILYNNLQSELHILSLGTDEANKEIMKKKRVLEEKEIIYSGVHSNVTLEIDEFILLVTNLSSLIENSLLSLKNNLKDKLINEARYILVDKKEKLDVDILASITKTTIKDSSIEILREYKYKLMLKCEKMVEIIEYQSQKLNEKVLLNLKEVVSSHFSGSLFLYNSINIENIVKKEAKKWTKSNISNANNNLDVVLNNEFESIRLSMISKIEVVNIELIKSMKHEVLSEFLQIQNSYKLEQKSLENQKELLDSRDKEDKKDAIIRKIEKLEKK